MAAAQWEMQTSKGWIDAPFKAPASGASAGKKAECVFEGVPISIKFLSETTAEVMSKGKTYPARVKAATCCTPVEVAVASDAAKAAADDSVEQMNPLVVFDALATDGAVRPKEFALIVQLEACAALKQAAFGMLEQANSTTTTFDGRPCLPFDISGIKPAIKRGVERMDVSHMRTLLEMLFRVMDGNKNGKIEREEFEGFFNKLMGMAGNPAEAMDFAFSMVDKNGNGKLSLDEAQEVIDSVLELATTLVASVADGAETIVNAPEFKETAIQALKGQIKADFGGQEGDFRGTCNETDKDLSVGPDWFHKPGSNDDYCKESLDKYQGEDKAQFIVIDTKEKLGDEAALYGLDFSNLVSREDLTRQLEDAGVMDMMAEAFADNAWQQLVNSLKVTREAFGKFESNIGAQFYMKALEWGQGGVDEATFLCQVVPLLRVLRRILNLPVTEKLPSPKSCKT